LPCISIDRVARSAKTVPAQREYLVRVILMASTAKPVRRQSLASSRLRKHADYLRAYAAGRKRQSAAMSWFLAPQSVEAPQSPQSKSAGLPAAPRVGLTVGKVMGKAHERNRIKRRMREALRRHVDLLPAGFDLIFHPRRSVLTIEFSQLEREVVRILQQAEAQAREHSLDGAARSSQQISKHSSLKAPRPPAS
jgi:ribonuclease P protein component